METVVTDKAGRRLTLRKVGVLETLRLYKALGPELSNNDSYMGLARIAASVAMVDEVPVPFPKDEQAVEACLTRIGDDGADVVEGALLPQPLDVVVRDAGN